MRFGREPRSGKWKICLNTKGTLISSVCGKKGSGKLDHNIRLLSLELRGSLPGWEDRVTWRELKQCSPNINYNKKSNLKNNLAATAAEIISSTVFLTTVLQFTQELIQGSLCHAGSYAGSPAGLPVSIIYGKKPCLYFPSSRPSVWKVWPAPLEAFSGEPG